jgi:hypothetical protein
MISVGHIVTASFQKWVVGLHVGPFPFSNGSKYYYVLEVHHHPMPWYKVLSVILEIGSTSYKLLEGGLFVSLLGLLLVMQNVLYQVGTCPCPKHFHHHHGL